MFSASMCHLGGTDHMRTIIEKKDAHGYSVGSARGATRRCKVLV